MTDDTIQLLFADETFRIRGAIFEVSRQMGPGCLEAVYQQCLGLQFGRRSIPFRPRRLWVGLLVNFGDAAQAAVERIVMSFKNHGPTRTRRGQ